MSSTSSKTYLFSVDPFTLSNNSLFSTEEYNHVNIKWCQHEESNGDIGQSSNSLFPTEPFNLNSPQKSKVVTNLQIMNGLIHLMTTRTASISLSIFKEFNDEC